MAEWRANRTQSALRAVGGKLMLTDTDLEFLPHAVDMALRRLLGEPMTRDEILALQGVGWSGDLDAARRAEAGELG